MRQTKRIFKTNLSFPVIIALCASLVAACSGQTSSLTGISDSNSAPITITRMNPNFNPEPPKKDSEAQGIIEKYTHTKLDITWVPSSSYNDKLNAEIAAGTLPEIVYVLAGGNRQSAIVNAVRSGMFWDVGPYLKDYKNLGKISPSLLAASQIDGKLYGIPRDTPLAWDGIVIRKDWLDHLGLQEPKTLDELIQDIKAFALNDPDGNGKQDTFGVGVTSNISGFQTLLTYYGGPNGWDVQNGKLIPAFMTPEYLEVLKLFKSFYDQHVINQDFAAKQDPYELLSKGQAGIYFGALSDVERRFNPLFNIDPKAQLDVINRIEGRKGVRIQTRGVFPPLNMFPKTSIKTEAQLKQVLSYMDKMADPDMQNLFTWGIEGEHYKMENGKPVITDPLKFSNDITSMITLKWDDNSLAIQGSQTPLADKYNKMIEENLSFAVPNPTQSLISNTDIEQGANLDKLINDARTKFIMGQLDEAGWNQAIADWRKQGGDKIMAEYTDEYAKASKK